MIRAFTFLAISAILSGCVGFSSPEQVDLNDKYRDCKFYHKIHSPEVMSHVYCPVGE